MILTSSFQTQTYECLFPHHVYQIQIQIQSLVKQRILPEWEEELVLKALPKNPKQEKQCVEHLGLSIHGRF